MVVPRSGTDQNLLPSGRGGRQWSDEGVLEPVARSESGYRLHDAELLQDPGFRARMRRTIEFNAADRGPDVPPCGS